MRVRVLRETLLIVAAGFLAVTARAADPPANGPTDSQDGYARAVEEARRIPPDEALKLGRELRPLSDRGDADATFRLYLLISMFGRFGPLSDAEHAKGWSEVAGNPNALDWLLKAASQGSKDAMPFVCSLADDKLAPADRQEAAQVQCEALKRKYPDSSEAAGK